MAGLRQLSQLATHHGTAPHTRNFLWRTYMGRGGRSAGQQPWSGGGNGFRVWPGAYSPQGPKDRKPPWKADGRTQPEFPAYSAMQLPQERAALPGSSAAAMDVPRSMNTNSIQNALNITRNWQSRDEIVSPSGGLSGPRCQDGWLRAEDEGWPAQGACSLERLLRDIAEAESAQETARMGLRAAFAEERSAAIGGIDVDMGGQDVDRLFAEWAREDSTVMDGVLRRALAPAGTGCDPGSFTTPTRTTAAALRTPTLGPAPGIAATPPATADPYLGMTSPFPAPPGLSASPNPGQNPVAPCLSSGPPPGTVARLLQLHQTLLHQRPALCPKATCLVMVRARP